MSPSDIENDDVNSLNFENIKYLSQFIKPYKKLIFLAILFMFISVSLGVSFPLISKYAIDEYIVKTYQTVENIDATLQKELLAISTKVRMQELSKNTYAIASSDIKKIDPSLAFKLNLSKKRYYLFPCEKLSNLDNADNFIKYGEYYLINETNLSDIPVKYLFTLRGSDWHGVIWLSGLALILICITFCTEFLQVWFTSRAAQHTMIDLRAKVFSHIETLSLDYFNKQPIGRLMTRVTNDISSLNEMLSSVLIQSWHDLLILFGTLIVLLFLNFKLALLIIAVVPLFVLVIMFFQKKLQVIYRKSRNLLSSLNAQLAEDISGFKIIKIFLQSKRRQGEYHEINKNYFVSTFQEVKWFGFFRPSFEIVCALGLTIVFIYGGNMTIDGTMTIGAFYTFITYVERMFRPLAAMIDKYNVLLSASSAAERVVQVLSEKPSITESDNAVALESKINGQIKFDNVSFSYLPGQPILKGLNIEINPGESIAIVGATGSGKSTIISLLCRFYEVNQGCITIDGKNINDYTFADLRNNIAIVLQEAFIFSRSVYDNLKMGKEFTEEEILTATKNIQAHNFISKFPDGYNTIMAERGSTLSAGQRQLICFARALLHDPKILILDEATSNIDPKTEQLIQKAIEKLMKNRTSIIVAHRLSTIRHADKIVVLDAGEILEIGNHDELMAKRGAYYNLYLLQYQGQED